MVMQKPGTPQTIDPLLEFCHLCRTDRRPRLDKFIEAYPQLSSRELAAILRADLRFGWSAGDRPQCEAYFRMFPSLVSDQESAIDIVYTEFLVREERGEHSALEEWTNRFPAMSSELCRQIDFHRSLNEFSRTPDPSTASPLDPGTGYSAAPTSVEETRTNAAVRTEHWPPHETDRQAAAHPLPFVPGYHVIELVGRGGMGVVYRARQESLGRDVALKFLHRSDFASESQLVRFQREAAAISRLRHPNFVQIHDYGTHEHCPYLVLEYVDGGTLADKISGVAQPIGFAAACMETLATAMHYAHQHGVVHRDLKPNNVLITSDGVFKITDLGLAKQLPTGPELVERHTESGAVIGTPAYMAPEQMSGDIAAVAPSTDVYALGVILYQLLTGTLPFQAVNLFQLLNEIQSHEPISPGDLRPDISRDLETICLKCLRKDPEQRYASAADLATDLHNFRGGKPITARPIRSTERVWRWARRNPLVAGLLATVLLLLGGGLWVTTSLYLRAIHQAARADENYQVALQAVETYLSNVSESADLKSHGMEPLRKQLLTTAQDFYQQLLLQQSTDFEVSTKLAEAHYRLGYIQHELGDRDAAIQHYAAAQDAYRRLTVTQPDVPEHAYWLALCHANLGGNLEEVGDFLNAEVHQRKSREIRQELCRRFPQVVKYRLHYLHALCDLVLLYGATNQPSLERASYEDARAVYDGLLRVSRSDLSDDDELYQVHKKMGGIFRQRGMIREAQTSFRGMRQQCQELVDRFPDLPQYQYQLAASNSYLALLSQDMGHSDDARQAYDATDAILLKLTKRYPQVCNYRFQRAVHLMNRGGLEFAQAAWDEAESNWQRSRDLVNELRLDFPPIDEYTLTLAQLAINLGNVYYSRKEFDAASQEYQQSLELGLTLLHAHPEGVEYQNVVGTAYHGLGTAQFAAEQYDEALEHLEKARAIREQLVTARPDVPIYQSWLGSTLHNLADVYGATDRPELAESSYRAACDIAKQLCETYPDTLEFADTYGDSLNNLGNLLLDNHRIVAAVAECEKARGVRERLIQQDPQCSPYRNKLGHVTYNLGRGQLLCGDADAACRFFQQAAEHFRSASDRGGADSRESVRDSLVGLARSRYRLGDYARAIEAIREAESLEVEPHAAELTALSARCQARQGQFIAAVEVADTLLEQAELTEVTLIDLAAVYAMAANSNTASLDSTLVEGGKLADRAVDLLHGVAADELATWSVADDEDFKTLLARQDCADIFDQARD